MNIITTHWGFIIKTNEYAGNFERQLCAHCTGESGECGVGLDYINESNKNLFEEDCIIQVPDDHGCSRPCSIWTSAGCQDRYRSVIIYFENKPSQQAIDIIKERSKTFINAVREKDKYLYGRLENLEILGFSIVEFKTEEIEIDI
jgi:hypothetical protein